MIIVICIRHPDFDNEFRTFGRDALEIIDVDFGRMDLRDPDEFRDWRESVENSITSLQIESDSNPAAEAAEFLRELVAQAVEDYDQEGGE